MINTAKKVVAATAVAVGILSSHVAVASLMSSGPGLVYDSVANVTWSSDANLFATMSASNPNLVNQIIAAVPTVYDTPNGWDNAGPGAYTVSAGDFSGGGSMDWFAAKAFAGYLNSIAYLGHTTWALPTTYSQSCTGYNCTNSMLGELFYTGLGGTAGTSILTSNNGNTSLFTNIQNVNYWSGTENATFTGRAWAFDMTNGNQTFTYKGGASYYAWLVLPGNQGPVSSISEPAGFALFGIGMFGLMSIMLRPTSDRRKV